METGKRFAVRMRGTFDVIRWIDAENDDDAIAQGENYPIEEIVNHSGHFLNWEVTVVDREDGEDTAIAAEVDAAER